MDLDLPPIPQQSFSLCVLSQIDDHHRLIRDLDAQVFVATTHGSQIPPTDELVALLRIKYGGSASHWSQTIVGDGVLTRLPPWLRSDDLIDDSAYWERGWGLQMLPWQCVDNPKSQPLPLRVQVTIWDFPLEYWHLHYFKQVTASMGTITGFHRRHIDGRDKSCISLYLDCPNVHLVPFKLYVLHNERWSECKVTLHGRQESENPNSPGPPPGGDQPLRRHEIVFFPPVPPESPLGQWRRRNFANNFPIREPDRSPAPAAGLVYSLQGWCTSGMPTPGLFQKIWTSTRICIKCDSIPARKSARFRSIQYFGGPSVGFQHFDNPFPKAGQIKQTPALCLSSQGYRSAKFSTQPEHSITVGLYSRYFQKDARTFSWPLDDQQLSPRNPDPHHIAPKESQPRKRSLQSHASIPSILGPHPLSNKFKTANSQPPANPNKPHHSLRPLSNITNSTRTPSQIIYLPDLTIPYYYPARFKNHPHLSISPLPQPSMAMTPEDEALIQKFIGLNTSETQGVILQIPHHATTSANWDLSVLLRIISDKTVLDEPFAAAMGNAWNSDPVTKFSPVARNCYLVQFESLDDMNLALFGGPWTYRGDFVASRQVHSNANLNPAHVVSANLWVQMYNIPVNSFTDEGLLIIARELGKPLTALVKGFVGGRSFYKVKVMVQISEPLKDHVIVTHPTMGQVKALCSWEKVARVCSFCGQLGHEILGCHDHLRLSMLMQSPAHAATYDVPTLLAPKFGPWLTKPNQIPINHSPSPYPKNKRAHADSTCSSSERNSPERPLGSEPPAQPLYISDLGYLPESSNLTKPHISVKKPRPAGQIAPDTLI